jgi:site-specific recombinase XerD
VARSWRAAGADGDTWVVLARDHSVVGPAEEFLEHLRVEGYSPNTVKQYARALALWWSLLEDSGRDWRGVGVTDLAAFTRRVRARGVDPAVLELRPSAPAPDSTVGVTVRAVMSFYRFHALAGGVDAAQGFYLRVRGSFEARSPYMPFLGHVARGGMRSVAGRRRGPVAAPPVLLPQQIKVIKDDAARWDAAEQWWAGDLRYRLFWSLLEETGLRLAEALLLQHRDWHTGTGTTAFIEVVPREDHRRRLRVKGQKYRRLYIGDALDDLTAHTCAASPTPGRISVTATLCSPTWCAGRWARRFGPKACMRGCGRSSGATRCCRRAGARTGSGIATPPPCCWRARRCMWCSAAWGTQISRP